jgi:hypothetical protein
MTIVTAECLGIITHVSAYLFEVHVCRPNMVY